MTSIVTDRPVRPANRRSLIAGAAGKAFAERGYHAVAMDDIASAVGITAAALYRHFPNKYALFVECATTLADSLSLALQDQPVSADLDRVLEALARSTVANRANGGIYRWESRYLTEADRRVLGESVSRTVGRVTEAIRLARPDAADLDEADLRLLAVAALGAIGSVTAHRTTMGARRLEALVVTAARDVALRPLPIPTPAPGDAPDQVDPVIGTPERNGRRQQILDAAVPLFHRDGYAEASMSAIADAVGLTPSGLYRHYKGKADILLAACLQAAEVLDAAVHARLAGTTAPEDAVRALAAAYVGYAFEHTALTSVATAESGGLPAAVQRPIRTAQRAHVELWERRLRALRPELETVEARVLVHAGLGVVTETGRALHWIDTPTNRVRVADLALAALGVERTSRT